MTESSLLGQAEVTGDTVGEMIMEEYRLLCREALNPLTNTQSSQAILFSSALSCFDSKLRLGGNQHLAVITSQTPPSPH